MTRALLFMALVSVAACGPAPGPAGADPETLARGLMAVWESGDTRGLDTLTAERIRYDDVPNGMRLGGREAVRAYIDQVHAWADNVSITIDTVTSGPTAATIEWTMHAVQDRPIPGRVPVATNRTVTLRGATIVEVADGRIVRAADYLDTLGFLLQLGAKVELPGGVTLGPG
ncbi:MAG: nuclear transport factor 2 family protein [Gemmatimonadales bacterium]